MQDDAAPRRSESRRKTSETSVAASVCIDGSGAASAGTGVAFLDHMIASLAKHSMIDIDISAESLDGIEHHLVEDAAITLGAALDGALGDRHGIARFGSATAPMDEALAEAAVDLVRRPFSEISLGLKGASVEGVAREDLEHFVPSLVQGLCCCAHVTVTRGRNDHHRAEAAIKALALALRAAASRDARRSGAPSSKGAM